MLIVTMSENTPFTGEIMKNPFHSEHLNLNKIVLYGGERCILGQPMESWFRDRQYLRSYIKTKRALNYYNTDDTNGLTPIE